MRNPAATRTLEALEQAQHLLAQQRFDEAHRQFEQLIAAHPRKREAAFAHAYVGLARCHLARGASDDAVSVLLRAVKIFPRNAEVHDVLADVLEQQEHLVDAAMVRQTALLLDPSRQSRYLKLANLYRQLEEWDAAERVLKAALHAEGDKSLVHQMLAELYHAERNFQKTIAEALRALEANSRNVTAMDVLISAYVQEGNLDAAIAVGTEQVALMPSDAVSRFKLGALHHQKGDMVRAAEQYQRIVEQNPDNDWAGDAREALYILDQFQLHQIFVLASDDFVFRVKLKRAMEKTLTEYGFRLTDSAMAMLATMDFDAALAREGGEMRHH